MRKFSFVVPHYDRHDHLINLLNCLPESIPIAIYCNSWFARACNRAVRSIDDDSDIFLINDDIIITKEDIRKISSSDSDITGARLYYPNGKPQHLGICMSSAGFPSECVHEETMRVYLTLYDKPVVLTTGACMYIRRYVWDDLGGFDENFINSYDDVDLCLRAIEKGYSISIADTHVIHHTSQSKGRFDNDLKNHRYFVSKWINTGRIYKILGR